MISVVIPAYNSGAYIKEAITSVLRQSLAVGEIIIVDDGSTDDTRDICATLDGAVRYIHQDNQGPAAARNRGIAEAQGDFVAFLDADDQWLPEKIALQMEVFARYPDVALVAGDMVETDKSGQLVIASVFAKHGMRDFFEALQSSPIPNALSLLIYKNFIPTGAVVVRRSALDSVGMFTPCLRYGEDLELWSRVAARFPIVCVPVVLILRRKHGTNVTRSTEPLLMDLVKAARIIRGWGATALRQQNIDPDRMVAHALNDLAYFLFSTGHFKRARRLFLESLRESATNRAFTYAAACMLPDPLITRLRRFKQSLGNSGEIV